MQRRKSEKAVHQAALGALSRARLALAALFVCVGISTGASAGQVLIRYDANDTFPEEEGWTRYLHDPEQALIRTLDQGRLALDTRGSLRTSDTYEVESASLTPGPGETLRVTWRVQTAYSTDIYGSSEVTVAVVNQDHQYAAFRIGPDFVAEDRFVFGYSDLIVDIDEREPHTYQLITSDLREYAFYVDGSLGFVGDFHWETAGTQPHVAFGDFLIGGVTSIAEWDYMEVAVIPEPKAVLLLLCGALVVARWRFMTCVGK